MPGSALADTTIDFEQFPPGTVITNQYADAGGPGQGVVFGPLPGGAPGEGLHPVVRMPPAGHAQSGTQVADIATCLGCEFFTPRTTGTLAAPRSSLSVRVGYLGDPATCTVFNPDAVGCAVVRLRAYDANGNQIAESSALVTRGAGVHSLLSVSTPSATIVGFELSGRSGTDDSKPIAIDDLSFGTAPPPTPDFTLNPAATDVTIEQGGSATDAITIGRLGGSIGEIALSASGRPPGVSVDFAPNPAPGTQTVLTLSADSSADPTTTPLTITGTPQSPSAGPAPRSFTLNLTVQPACPEVRTAQELVDKLAAGFKCIFVVGEIDLTEVPEKPVSGPDSILGDPGSILTIPDGVTLMGTRSATRVGGLLEMSHRIDKSVMLMLGSNTRVSGLRLRGYQPSDRHDRHDSTRAMLIEGSSGVTIDNNEISGWPNAGVEITMTPDERAETPRITGNFIHNNVQCNHGYGVVVSRHGFARIDRNVFNYNRHDVAGHGSPGDGYIADLNFALTSGPKCNPGHTFQHYNQHYDMHGLDGGTGGIAGTFIEIRRNTIRGAQSYAAGFRKRPAFWLRGTPVDKAVFVDNAVPHGDDLGGKGAVRVSGAFAPVLMHNGKLVIRHNQLCVDTAGQLAVGDFNGDGRDDVFQAVGTLWVYSPGGSREWFFLNSSERRLGQLGLGDFDGDGKTDVFVQDGDRWLVSDGGSSRVRQLPAGSKIDIKRYRFADFDGDGRTDIFRANGSRFFISSAGTTAWQPLVTSHLGLDDLRFGDFDGDGKTDVFSLANDQWSVSFGGTTRWQRLNRKLSSKLGSLAFADFNGDDKTDVARTHDGNWQVSLGGATPWRTLQFRRSEPLNVGMLLGDFNGDRRDDVLQHGERAVNPSLACSVIRNGGSIFRSFERFRLSSAAARPFVTWSSADMR